MSHRPRYRPQPDPGPIVRVSVEFRRPAGRYPPAHEPESPPRPEPCDAPADYLVHRQEIQP